MIYAPIIIPTLNRYECLKKCVESLQKNTWADETELYISVDYPPAEKYEYGYRKIKEYLDKEITGFKKVNVFFQGKNLGPIENVNWLYEKAFSKYDRVIFMEDDNEVAPSFIQFCDKGLELFDRYEDIIAIRKEYDSGTKLCEIQRKFNQYSKNTIRRIALRETFKNIK